MGVIEDFYSHFIWTIDEKSCCSYEMVRCRAMRLASSDLSDSSACSKINFVLINSFINSLSRGCCSNCHTSQYLGLECPAVAYADHDSVL